MRAAPAGHRARSRGGRLRRPLLAAEQEVQDRPDHAHEHDHDRPQALVATADPAVIAQQVDHGEHHQPELHHEQGDEQQHELRRDRFEAHDH
ncbi:MAG: hypothetical protein A2V85_05095 [Chloroflexi bacterium RBG_16_72_14]|nr:MAG: hypothetical protein A2V85_05095 [Chloroflexi bacterium RBG_16_72_14]